MSEVKFLDIELFPSFACKKKLTQIFVQLGAKVIWPPSIQDFIFNIACDFLGEINIEDVNILLLMNLFLESMNGAENCKIRPDKSKVVVLSLFILIRFLVQGKKGLTEL